MLDYLNQRNQRPKPFTWTGDADLISLDKLSDFVNVFLAQNTAIHFAGDVHTVFHGRLTVLQLFRQDHYVLRDFR